MTPLDAAEIKGLPDTYPFGVKFENGISRNHATDGDALLSHHRAIVLAQPADEIPHLAVGPRRLLEI